MFQTGQKVRQTMSVEYIGDRAQPLRGKIIRQLWKVGETMLVETDRDRPLFTEGIVVKYSPSSWEGIGFVSVDVIAPMSFRSTFLNIELALIDY